MRAKLPLFKRTLSAFRADGLSDWAAALTYYGLLSLFPAVIALISIIGLVGDPETTTREVTEVITEIGPTPPRRPSPARWNRSPPTAAPPVSPSSSASRSRSVGLGICRRLHPRLQRRL